MTSLELTSAITALANGLSYNLSPSELALIAGVLVQLGDTITTIAAQRALCKEITTQAQKQTRDL